MARTPENPYYVLTVCCPGPEDQPLYFRIGDTPLPIVPGVYQFGGIDQYDLVRGKCYTVTQEIAVLPVIYPFIPAGTNFTYLEEGCDDILCGCKTVSCFILTNCTTDEVLYSTNSNLLEYALTEQVVNILGYEGCWTVDVFDGLCDCAVSITVLQHFNTCEECLPYIAYKLINCNVSSQIIYTTQDLSAYVGQTVNLDCGGCWIVEQIDYQPPSVQIVGVIYNYESCIACERDYYILEDCSGIEDDVYTYTDLLDYVGQVIQIKGCDTCWNVAPTNTPVNAGVVTLAVAFNGCTDCLNSTPTECGTVANYDTVTHAYIYLDYTGAQQSITLRPSQVSDRVCIREWVTEVRPTDNYQYFGLCTNGMCPPKVYPKRTVTPGYDTPGCSAEKFERITCQASEIYYKMVLERRYGISSCCGEENDRILIRKELIDLQALVDPDYICTPVEACCCPTPAGAGYISLEITNPTCPTPRVAN